MRGNLQYLENVLTTKISKTFILATFVSFIHMRFEIPMLGLVTVLLLCLLFAGLGYRYVSIIWSINQNARMKGGVITLISFSHLFFACTLGIVRLVPRNEEIVWGIDNRMFLSRAYKYLHFGNQDESLSYFGFDYKYHAMPSYMSAQLDQYLQIPPSVTLFLILPILIYLTIFIVVFEISRFYGLNEMESGLISILICSFNYLNSITQVNKLLNPLISIDLMPNTGLALAVVICAVRVTVIDITRVSIWLTVVGFSLVAIKPQFIPFFWLIVIMVHLLIPKIISKKLIFIYIIAGISSLLMQVMYNLGNTQAQYSLTLVSPDFVIFLKTNSFVIAFWTCLAAHQLIMKSKINPKIHILFGVYLMLRLFFDVMFFSSTGSTEKLSKRFLNLGETGDSDFNQGFILLYLAICISLLVNFTRNIQPRFMNSYSGPLTLVLLGVVILRFLTLLPGLINPEVNGREPINLQPLHRLLSTVQVKNPLFLVNDVSDPTENYRRFGSGMYWSSIGIGQFYLSDIATGHFLAPDIGERKTNATKFFTSDLSQWHTDFLDKEGIDYILINTRCEPSWINQVNISRINDRFILLSKSTFINGANAITQIIKPQIKKSGIAPCL